MIFYRVAFLGFLLFFSFRSHAQEIDLFAESETEKQENITKATFKSTRVINGQSIENTGKGVLDFKILHRFDPINKGGYELFGLDRAFMRIGFDYGITNRLEAGIGRSNYQKQYDEVGRAHV